MTETLFDLTYKAAVKLGSVIEGKATGGSTTTLIDTKDRVEADDYWNRGAMWLLRDSAGAGAAPEGEFSIVDDFVQSTATLTLRETLTAGIAAGDKYALGKRRFPLATLIQKVNDALRSVGEIPQSNTALVTVAGQSEYSLPSAEIGRDLREVYIQRIQDSDDNQWDPLYDWDIQESAPGTPDILIVNGLRVTGMKLKLVYVGYHPELNLVTDKMSDSIHSDLIVLQAALEAAKSRKAKLGGSDPALSDLISGPNGLVEQVALAKSEHPIIAPSPQPHLLAVNRFKQRYPGDQSPR